MIALSRQSQGMIGDKQRCCCPSIAASNSQQQAAKGAGLQLPTGQQPVPSFEPASGPRLLGRLSSGRRPAAGQWRFAAAAEVWMLQHAGVQG